MDWLHLPPLGSLRAFTVFSHARSVTAAGGVLNVSHAAISQQMRNLEEHLGVALLDRQGRNLVLTAKGQKLADTLTKGFATIDQGVAELRDTDAARPLQVTSTPTFAMSWLMPRLAHFRTKHPEIDVMLNTTPELVTLEPGGTDIALRYGQGDWDGMDSEPLLQSPMVVVAAPSLVGDCQITCPADLAGFPWLQELGANESTDWLRRQGFSGERSKGMLQLPGNLLLDGVRDGQGVAVTILDFVKRDIQAGRLRVLFETNRQSGYYIVTRQGVMRPTARKFVAWLRRQNVMQTETRVPAIDVSK